MIETSGNIFVTGATGFLGSHFALEWLRTQSGHVFALVRGSRTLTGASRLAAALEVAQLANGTAHPVSAESITPIDGDVTHPLAGVAPENVVQMRKASVETFWHFASDLRYEDSNREAMWRTNVFGVRHALDLAVAVGVKRFVYVSTAYVCGRQSGLIEETLVPPYREFSNSYEASKAEAERLLAKECERLGLLLTIFRPSIVIGPSTTRCSYGSEAGLFALMHTLMWIRTSQSGRTANLRIPALADAELNFIPVDCVVSDMLFLAKSGFGNGRIYHLTSTSWVSVALCWKAISEAIDMHNVVLMPRDSFEPNPAERLVARRIGFFLSYIGIDRRFIRSLSPTMTPNGTDFADYVCKERDRVEGDTQETRHAG
jgi:nucleoside-diphosphate-sugar epimerase